MKEQINLNIFCDRFKQMNRDNNFSCDGKKALFDYLEQYEEDIGQEIELNIIDLCCEYNEYENLEEYLKNYDTNFLKEDYDDEEDFKKAVFEEIQNKTTLIKIDNSENFLIEAY